MTVAAEIQRPSSARPALHRVLVIADDTCAAPELCAGIRAHAAGRPLEILVLAPAHGPAAPTWIVDEDAAAADAARRLRECVDCLGETGMAAHARVADPDAVQAVADALHDFPADEIVVFTGEVPPSRWLHQNVIDRLRDKFAQPIEHVVVTS